MAGDVVGTTALALAPVAGGLYLWVNRCAPVKACRHGHAEALYCFQLNCRYGAVNWLELGAMTAFFVTLSVGLAWYNDPEGWLEMGRGIGSMPMGR